MEMLVFTLLDTKSGVHSPPFFMAHTGQAVRACQDLGADRGTSVGRHPADFMLVQLGTWDDQNGQFSNGYTPMMTVASLLPSGNPAGLFGYENPNNKESV